MPERDGERIYNTSFVFDPQGRQIARHRKMHLFDIDVAGGQRFFESDTFTAGRDVTVFDVGSVRIGLCICFDMRFPELARLMALQGAQITIVPAAFNMTTGPAHWEIMFRERAVDNQVFTVGVAPARDEHGPYVSYGNSIVCSPWGDVIRRAGADEWLEVVDLDLAAVTRVRAQLPLLSARREDLYELKERSK
jgi:predicted amidohydrolase